MEYYRDLDKLKQICMKLIFLFLFCGIATNVVAQKAFIEIQYYGNMNKPTPIVLLAIPGSEDTLVENKNLNLYKLEIIYSKFKKIQNAIFNKKYQSADSLSKGSISFRVEYNGKSSVLIANSVPRVRKIFQIIRSQFSSKTLTSLSGHLNEILTIFEFRVC
jgi:hypothetical protein